MTPRRLSYRPSLDGLRGVAVLLVVADHVEELPVSGGGSVGVTMFFVLSGYLITSLLLAELEDHGRIDVVRFYARRAARLFPALALLLLAVGATLVATSQRDIAIAGVTTAALYVSNFAIAAGANTGPLEHTWSLAIEEQFYVVWPLALIVLARRPRLLVGGIFAGIVASAVLRLGPLDDMGRLWTAYHLTVTRADALLVGCLSALVPFNPSRPMVASAALLLLAAVAVPLGPGTQIVVLLLPVAVAAAVLVKAQPAMFAWSPLVSIGRISYGIYLWHFALLWWLPAIPAVALTFLISTASYRLLELPVRESVTRRLSARAADRTSLPARSNSVAVGLARPPEEGVSEALGDARP